MPRQALLVEAAEDLLLVGQVEPLRRPPLIEEATQGSYYAQLIALMACDPNVALLNFFHAVDETSLPAWQSGVVLPDGTPRASYAAVKEAIAAGAAGAISGSAIVRIIEKHHSEPEVMLSELKNFVSRLKAASR